MTSTFLIVTALVLSFMAALALQKAILWALLRAIFNDASLRHRSG
jgi:hypothetical protein